MPQQECARRLGRSASAPGFLTLLRGRCRPCARSSALRPSLRFRCPGSCWRPAWPAYLLGRAVTGRVGGGYFAAALTAFTPWLVLSSTLLTENAAYPAFVWGVFLCYRGLVEPSAGRDAAAVGGLVLAYLARTQLFVLAVALPIAILAHERDVRRAVARHRLLAAAYGAGAAAAVGLAAA